ncbi:Uncharacterised protein [Yokenella regensburgei]|uniref:Uncharacterized protein n=1 Tax=Yokenella regensburgei TaxID=158877 RepID=A0AB38FTS8_9ENTR|nr:Uncharacterised protein [Yokenella regensburgei]SQA66906.1 Uncharacterised protein [Yokenella regensburgei]SUQ05350.1 Uncharacterised protein [Yokenella regensburgei]
MFIIRLHIHFPHQQEDKETGRNCITIRRWDGTSLRLLLSYNAIIDTNKGLIDAHSRAITCGSMSGCQCFQKTQETPGLGKKLCGQR